MDISTLTSFLLFISFFVGAFIAIYGIIKIVEGNYPEGAKTLFSALLLVIISSSAPEIVSFLFPSGNVEIPEIGVLISVNPSEGYAPLTVTVTIINFEDEPYKLKIYWGTEEEVYDKISSKMFRSSHTFETPGSYLVEVYVTNSLNEIKRSVTVEVKDSPTTPSKWSWSWIASQLLNIFYEIAQKAGLIISRGLPLPNFLEALYFFLFLPTTSDMSILKDIYWNISFPIGVLLLSSGIIVSYAHKTLNNEKDVLFNWFKDLFVWSIFSVGGLYFYDLIARILNGITIIFIKDCLYLIDKIVSPIYAMMYSGIALSYFIPILGNLSLTLFIYLVGFYATAVVKYFLVASFIVLIPIIMSLKLLIPFTYALDPIFDVLGKILIIGPISASSLLLIVISTQKFFGNDYTLAYVLPLILMIIPVIILRVSGLGSLRVK